MSWGWGIGRRYEIMMDGLLASNGVVANSVPGIEYCRRTGRISHCTD
jgi:hypothetical protein